MVVFPVTYGTRPDVMSFHIFCQSMAGHTYLRCNTMLSTVTHSFALQRCPAAQQCLSEVLVLFIPTEDVLVVLHLTPSVVTSNPACGAMEV